MTSGDDAAKSAKAYSPEQMEEIWSAIHDERRTVTTKSVCLELGVSHRVASSLLKDLPYHKVATTGADRTRYEATTCRTVVVETGKNGGKKKNDDGIRRTAVKLVKSVIAVPPSSDDDGDDFDNLYSLGLVTDVGVSTVASAHERALATLRDAVASDPAHCSALDPNLLCDVVRPSACSDDGGAVGRIDGRRGRERRMAAAPIERGGGGGGNDGTAKGGGGGKTGSSSFAPSRAAAAARKPPRKATTAASFFGTSSSSANKQTKASAKATTSDGKKRPKATGGTGGTEKGSDEMTKADENDGATDTKMGIVIDAEGGSEEGQRRIEKEKKGEEKDTKENAPTVDASEPSSEVAEEGARKRGKPRTKKKRKSEEPKTEEERRKIGNADDFVGDVDEDDEFLREDADRKKRNAAEARKKVRETADDANARRRAKSKISERRRAKPRSAGESTKEAGEEGARVTGDDEEEEDDGEGMDVEYDDVLPGDKKKESKKKGGVDSGAMDAFVRHGKGSSEEGKEDPSDQGRRPARKRRKKLTERTTVDSNGYLQTETVTVWEDVPTDEEEETKGETKSTLTTPAAAPGLRTSKGGQGGPRKNGATRPKGTKHLKQAGLMGFFAKKK